MSKNPSHVSEQLIHSTARLLTFDANNISNAGTGFFFQFRVADEATVPLLITNRHMLENMVAAKLCLTQSDEDKPKYGAYEEYTIVNLQALVVYHPEQAVDLAAIYLGGIVNDMTSKGKRPYYVVSRQEDLPSAADIASMTSFEEILMLGYPNGLWDSKNNLPLARRGYTATPYALDYEGRKEFVIDAACFPGSSGSPVYLYSSGPFATRTALVMGSRCKLLGLLYAGPVQSQQGKLEIVSIPTAQQQVVPVSQSPVHLGFCIKAAEILKLDPLVRAKIASANAQPTPTTLANK